MKAHWLTVILFTMGSISCKEFGSSSSAESEQEYLPMHASFMKKKDPTSSKHPRLGNVNEIIDALNIAPYHREGAIGQGLKIAVLDKGFTGLVEAIGKTLPEDTLFFPGKGNPPDGSDHGTKIAEIAYAVATGKPKARPSILPGPKMLLFNTSGFTNFQYAVKTAMQHDVDIIIYAQVWSYGGNFDGKGFINDIVNQATSQGIIWVNAAGNVGNSTYQSSIAIQPDGTVNLPFQSRYLRFQTTVEAPMKIALAWNDFQESIEYETSQDLDLYLEDESGNVIASSTLDQTGQKPEGEKSRNFSRHAREDFVVPLKPGTYRLRVQAKSNIFPRDSFMRINIDGPGVSLFKDELPPGTYENSILIPADNPTVVAVGASDVDYTSRSRSPFSKPDIVVASKVAFDDGAKYWGSSAGSAIAGGALAVLLSRYPGHDKDQYVAKLKELVPQPAREFRNLQPHGSNKVVPRSSF